MVNSNQNIPTTQAAFQTEAYINKNEVAKRLNKTIRTIDNWMAAGLITHYKIKRSVAFKWSEIEADLAATCRINRRIK
jgi:hypothetical protein